jgi:SAM-dependent methyltransferase
MAVSRVDLVERTLAHYRDKFAAHGDTPLGVDWNGPESQRLHFEQLLRLLPESGGFSLNDLGCGYGALLDVLVGRYRDVRYRGYDLNADMIVAASKRFDQHPNATFEVADRPLEKADFGVASGIFTLRLGRDDEQCLSDMQASLDVLDQTSGLGFGFNCLTSWSDPDRMRDYLYYPDPCVLFERCMRRYARNVALLHDYGLYAFTILVRKSTAVP